MLRENNRRLAQELNRARLDLREMHNYHEKERQDLQDEIVRLRQLAGLSICEDFYYVVSYCHNSLEWPMHVEFSL